MKASQLADVERQTDALAAPEPKEGPGVSLAVGIPLTAWLITAVPRVLFIWSALGKVDAQHVFLSEVGDYVGISFVCSLLGSVVAAPIAVPLFRVRRRTTALVGLGALSLVVYHLTNLFAIAVYGVRIT